MKGFRDLSKERRKTKMEEQAKVNDKAVGEILKSEQVKRYNRFRSSSAARAFADPEVVRPSISRTSKKRS